MAKIELNKEPIIIPIPLDLIEEVELVEAIEIEGQDTEYTAKNMLVVTREKSKTKQKLEDWKQIWQSLLYACSWSQFRRQFQKDHLKQLTKRHYPKLLLGTALVGIYWGVAVLPKNTTGLDQEYRSSKASLLSVTNWTKPLVSVSASAKQNYIKRFGKLAQSEMKKYNIPASIILALAISNSHFGTTALAQKGHNHFNITCATNPLSDGWVGQEQSGNQCWTHYQNAWTSFRANSLVLSGSAFAELKTIAQGDAQIWASALVKMQYPQAEKLAKIIAEHQLIELDYK